MILPTIFLFICILPLYHSFIEDGIITQKLRPSFKTIHSLNDSSLDSFFKENNRALIEFYAPWCSHCVRFQSEAYKIAETIHKRPQKISFAAIDITNNSKLATQFEVRGIPTLFFIQKGKVWKYEGSLTHDSIVAFIDSTPKQAYLSIWNSPLGPVGVLRGRFGTVKAFLMNILPSFMAYSGFSRWAAFFTLVIGVAFTIIIITILVVFLSVDHKYKSH